MNYIVNDCPCLDSDNITCQDCTQDNPGTETCINRNNCIIKNLISDYDSISNFNQNMKEIIEENEQLKKQLEFSRTHKTVLDAERLKYKQTLEEIINNLTDICDRECDFHWCKGTCPDSDCDYYTNINKINEVLNER